MSLGVLAWVIGTLEWRELGGLASIDASLGIPALLLAGGAYVLQAWRWQRLLAAQGVPVRTGRMQALFWIGNFYNSFLPGGIAGDAVRLIALAREHPQHRAGAAVSILADRLLGFATLLALAVLALGAQLTTAPAPDELAVIFAASAGALGLLAGGTLLITHTHACDALATRWLGTERVAGLRAATDALSRNHGVLLMATALSVGVWLVDFAALWLLARSAGLEAGLGAIAVAGCAAYVAATLPISVGGHGVREATLILVLGWVGVGLDEPERAKLLALEFWAVGMVWSLAGGCAILSRERRDKIESASRDERG